RGHEEMPVGALDIHVGQPVGGVVVLDARTRAQPAAPHPAVARARPRCRLAERALVGLLREAVDLARGGAFVAPADRDLVGRQRGQARAEAGIDVAIEHRGAGIDVRVDIEDAEAVFHGRLLPVRHGASIHPTGAAITAGARATPPQLRAAGERTDTDAIV